MFKLQSPSKHSPLDALYPSRHFFPLLKTVFQLIDFDAFSVSASFLFHLFHISKTFTSEDVFIRENKKKVAWEETGWIGRVGHKGQKLLDIQPWLVWLSGLSCQFNSQSGTCLGCGPCPWWWGAHERLPHIDVSLPFYPSLLLSKNKVFLKKLKLLNIQQCGQVHS